MNLLHRGVSFLVPKLRIVLHFLTAQGITLLGNMLFGLLCVRLLPTGDYAQYVVMFAVQGTILILADVGLSGSLIPLIGEEIYNRKLIADYVASLRHLGYQLYFLMGVGLIAFFPLLVRNRHWSWHVVAGMIAALLLSTWFVRMGSVYGAVLIILRDRSCWYAGQMIASLGTLALLGIFWLMHELTAFSAILINVSGFVFVGVFYFFRARHLLGCDGVSSVDKRRAIVRLALPNIPQAVFYAFQGQVALLLITYFGHNNGIAGVGALGRLGAIFSVFGYINPMLIEPYFAKLTKDRVISNYLITILIAGALCSGITLAAYIVPQLFLWVLGPKYSGLHYEIVLAVSASAMSTLSGVFWCIHTARRFIYWWSNVLSVGLIFVVQLMFVLKADLSTIQSALMLNLSTNGVFLVVNILTGIYGFARRGRGADLPSSVPSADAIERTNLIALQEEEERLRG